MPIIPITLITLIYNKKSLPRSRQAFLVLLGIDKVNAKQALRLLPDNHALLLGQEHSTIGDAECLVEGVDVTQCHIHTVLAE